MTKTEGALMFLIVLGAVVFVGWRQEKFNTRLVLALRRAAGGYEQQGKEDWQVE